MVFTIIAASYNVGRISLRLTPEYVKGGAKLYQGSGVSVDRGSS